MKIAEMRMVHKGITPAMYYEQMAGLEAEVARLEEQRDKADPQLLQRLGGLENARAFYTSML